VAIVVVCCLVPVLAISSVWVVQKKPWVMDDFRAGHDVVNQGTLRDQGRRGDPCAEAMAATYGEEPSYRQYDTPEDASAFYLGCYGALNGGSNDWWNVSGYLTA
jgi:hypothetical protein